MIYVVTGSPSGDTAKNLADKVFFVPAAVYRELTMWCLLSSLWKSVRTVSVCGI